MGISIILFILLGISGGILMFGINQRKWLFIAIGAVMGTAALVVLALVMLSTNTM